MTEFILVHGGLMGGYCWELLEPELERLGHRSFSMDLPIDDPAAGLDDYADSVVRAVEGRASSQAWLVGHSMGGLVVPRVALRREVGGILFLCAGLPARNEQEDRESYEARNPTNESHFIRDSDGCIRLSREHAIEDFMADVDPDLQESMFARMRRQATGPFERFAPISRFPDVPMRSIITSDDQIVRKELHRQLIRDRIGVESVELPGSHCPFLSRPAELARVMDELIR
jgi:pimeloyl-ACP methyl ester carboxylesterase